MTAWDGPRGVAERTEFGVAVQRRAQFLASLRLCPRPATRIAARLVADPEALRTRSAKFDMGAAPRCADRRQVSRMIDRERVRPAPGSMRVTRVIRKAK
ncbi:hypothetical protein GCM10027262_37140 [Nocardia tengchongensis]